MSVLCAYLMVVTRRHNLFQVFFIHYHFRSEALFRSHGGGGTVVIPAFRRLLREEASSILYMVNQTTMGQYSRTLWVLFVFIYFVKKKKSQSFKIFTQAWFSPSQPQVTQKAATLSSEKKDSSSSAQETQCERGKPYVWERASKNKNVDGDSPLT